MALRLCPFFVYICHSNCKRPFLILFFHISAVFLCFYLSYDTLRKGFALIYSLNLSFGQAFWFCELSCVDLSGRYGDINFLLEQDSFRSIFCGVILHEFN